MLNHYFSKGTQNEQFLYEDLVIEALQIYGHDVVYLPRELVNKDDLFGEDPLSKFDESYQIEMYMETVEGYEGEKELVSRFGLEIRDETTFVVARRRWDNVISISQNLITSMRPNEGDLIFMPNVNRIWEIAFVDIDDPFYQVDNLPVYKMFCRTFEYSSERLDTGISVIDNIETTYSTDQLTWQMIGEAAATVTYNENMASEDVSGGLLMQEDGTTGAGLGDNLTAEDEVGFEGYVNKYRDLSAAYKKNSGGLSKKDWGKKHYCGKGLAEGRKYRGLSAASCKSSGGGTCSESSSGGKTPKPNDR